MPKVMSETEMQLAGAAEARTAKGTAVLRTRTGGMAAQGLADQA